MMNSSESQTRPLIALNLDSRPGTEERALGSARLCNKVKLYVCENV